MRKFLAGLLAFIFILGFSCTAIGWAALETLFSPATYTSILRQPAFSDSAADLARGQIAQAVVAQGGDIGALLPAEDLNRVAEQLITGPWVAAEMERSLGVLFDWMDTDEPEPRLTVSLVEMKQQVPAILESLVVERLKQLPVCEGGYLIKALQALLSGNAVPLCLPDDFDVEGFVRGDALNLRGIVSGYLSAVPDEIDVMALAAQGGAESRLTTALLKVRAFKQQAATTLTLLGAVLLLLFLILGLLRGEPWRALFQWWGWTMLLAGGLALGSLGLIYAARATVWTWIVTSPNGALPGVLAEPARMLFMGVLQPVWSKVLFTGGVAAAVGLFLVLLAFALPRQKAAQHAGD